MKKKKLFYKRVWFWIVVIIVILAIIGFAGGGSGGSEESSSEHIYDDAEAIDVINGAGTEVLYQYSLIEIDSSDVTLEDLEDWYFNYVEEDEYQWYAIRYTDKDDSTGVFCIGAYVIDGAVLFDEGDDVYTYDGDSEDAVYYSPNDEDMTLEVAEISANDTSEEDSGFLSELTSLGTFEETTYTGSSDDVVTLENTGSPILLECSYSGEGNFIVYTVDDAGENVGLLVNTIGAYSGVVTDYQEYLDVTMLSVQASGDWSITVKPMDAMEELSNGETYSGDGVYYIDEEELSTIDMTNSGESNFIVYGVGSSYDLLANEVGEYSGTVIWTEPQSFFIVTSDGDWSISW